MGGPRVLIEEWFPVATVSAETRRETGAKHALPAVRYLHVWWARRPLTTSRASLLASTLPAWSKGWPEELRRRFPTRDSYRSWFLRLLGIHGDPVRAQKALAGALATGTRIPNPYGYPRAFGHSASSEDMVLGRLLMANTWGAGAASVLDPFSGGGSIPFEALRYGFDVTANELNPVACILLRATLDYPARFGPSLLNDIKTYGGRVGALARERLAGCFSRLPPNAVGACYLWARTVACPVTGNPVPLSPNWWVLKGHDPVAVALRAGPRDSSCRFRMVRGQAAVAAANPDEGTVRRGTGRSPWTGDAIDGDWIKAEAQAGRMGQQLYAVGVKHASGFDFRAPVAEDLDAIDRADAALSERWAAWEAASLIPTEDLPTGNKTAEPLRYGMPRWCDLFSPRQLLSLVTLLEAIREVSAAAREELPADRAEAVAVYLTLALDKCADRNSRMTRWGLGRKAILNTFDRHDFSMKWSHGELDGSGNLFPWALGNVVKAYGELSGLAQSMRSPLLERDGTPVVDRLRITAGNAASLDGIPDRSILHVNTDPPYKANVMYAECSDFFYVWQKRALGDVFPELFRDELTNKDEEAVANAARFAGMRRGQAGRLAEADYERKMAAAFQEAHRVLRDDGVMTVMFTHKEVAAWDSLATALIQASFTIKASWPVHTESEHSLHQAKKNAAASTILLACRKRPPRDGEPVWWEDLQAQVRETARSRAAEFEAQGIRGVDLYISTFGPVLSIISEHWPELTSEADPKTGEPLPLRPETALDLARQEVVALRKKGLLLGRTVQFDPVTDWYLMAWDAFSAAQFPADEARKLALALGLDLEADLVRGAKLLTKKQAFVALLPPSERRHRGAVNPDAGTFDRQMDAVHTAMLVYDEDGPLSCKAFLDRTSLGRDGTFRACLQALLHAVPRTQAKGKFVRPEAATLEALRLAFFDDIEPPTEEEPAQVKQQLDLLDGNAGGGDDEGKEDEG